MRRVDICYAFSGFVQRSGYPQEVFESPHFVNPYNQFGKDVRISPSMGYTWTRTSLPPFNSISILNWPSLKPINVPGGTFQQIPSGVPGPLLRLHKKSRNLYVGSVPVSISPLSFAFINQPFSHQDSIFPNGTSFSIVILFLGSEVVIWTNLFSLLSDLSSPPNDTGKDA